MPRGQRATEGDTRVAPNGYHYTRTKTEWVLTHRIVAEKLLGRPLAEGERIRFKDNDRSNLDPNNIQIMKARARTVEAKKARIQARIDELNAQLDGLEEED